MTSNNSRRVQRTSFHFVMRESVGNPCPARFPSEHSRRLETGGSTAGFFVLEPGIADYIDEDETMKWELVPLEELAADGPGTLRLVDPNTDPPTR